MVRTAVEDDAHRVLEAEDTGQVRGCDLADAVPDQCLGPHAPRGPELGQSDLKREDAGLRDCRVVDARSRLARGELIVEGPVADAPDDHIAALDSSAERRLLAQKLPAHSPPLWALPRADESKRRPALGDCSRVSGFRSGDSIGVFLQAVGQLTLRAGDDRQPVIVMCALERGVGDDLGETDVNRRASEEFVPCARRSRAEPRGCALKVVRAERGFPSP